MSPFDPSKPRQTLSTTSGVKVIVRDPPPPEPEWAPEPVEHVPRVVITPENQPVGDREAFAAWLTEKWGPFMQHKLRGTSAASTDEVVQHVLHVATIEYDKTGRLKHPGAFVGRVIDNELCNRHGKGRLSIDHGADPDAKVASAPDPESAAARAERWEKVRRYVRSLPDALRLAVEALSFEGLTLKQAEARLKVPVATLHWQHGQALKLLRDLALESERALAARRPPAK